MYSNTSVGGEPDSGSSCWALSSRSDCACSAQETLLTAGKRPPLPGTRGPGGRQLRGRLGDQRGPLQHLATPLPAPRPRAPMRLSPRARKAGRGAWGRHGDSCSARRRRRPRAWRDPAARGASCGRTVTPAAPGGPGARTAGHGHREALPRPWGWREGAASPRQALRPAGAPRGGQRCRSYFTDTTRKSSRVAPCTAASRKK